MKKNIAFVICSRTNSNRIKNKPFQLINGIPLIEHLIRRLQKTEIPVILAVPSEHVDAYMRFYSEYGVKIVTGEPNDPLARMNKVCHLLKLDAVIRVTHDKLFCDPDTLYKAIDLFWRRNLDYVHSNEFADGSAFEIISARALDQASNKFKNIEHISYAIKAITNQKESFSVPIESRSDARFLVDYPDDVTFLECLLSANTNECDLRTAIRYCIENDWVKSLNKLPPLTVYTCVYNGAEHLEQCINSVVNQRGFTEFEYLIIDDHSTDNSFEIACRYAVKYPNIKVMRNQKNMGLSSSSNLAISKARGKYICRLDADDFFFKRDALMDMMAEIRYRDVDVIYPANYFGSMSVIQPPNEKHHIGGALFSTSALNHLKFTEGLRNHDSLDVYLRAHEQLAVGYLAKPIFFYRQHDDSMSKTNLAVRAETERKLRIENVSIGP